MCHVGASNQASIDVDSPSDGQHRVPGSCLWFLALRRLDVYRLVNRKIYMFVHIYIYIYISIYACLHTYIDIYKYMYIHI